MSSASGYLQVWDYAIIFLGLTLSSLYGLYHGIRSRKKTTKGATFEYLLASRNIGMLPIAFSYFASLTANGTIIGHPVEVYSFGLQVVLLGVAVVPCIFVANEVFLPIYYRLKSGSLYEYLELRFNARIKSLITIMAVFQTIVLSSANIYGSATVMSQVTGISSWFIVIILSVLCIVYTTFGGIRAVILADFVQAVFMLLSLVLLVGFGVYYIGGDVSLIYERNLETRRLDIFEFDLNMNARLTFWNTTFGFFFSFLSLNVTSQFLVQRLMTAPNITVAKRANILGHILFVLSLWLSHCVGLVMYATFHGCDPLQSGIVENANQLVPVYLMKVLSSYVTLPGIIFTGILCASLSTLSSVYNSTATILFNMFPPMSDKRATLVCKVLVLTVGILSILGVALAEMFPNVLQSVMSIYAAVSAPLFGMFIIGIFCPQANIKVACVSITCSVCFLVYIIAGTLLVKPTLLTKPLLIDACDSLNNTSDGTWKQLWRNDTMSVEESSNVSVFSSQSSIEATSNSSPWSTYFPLSSMSYMWYSTVGTLFTLLLFATLSLFFGKETSKPVNLELIPEVVKKVHHKLPRNLRRILLCDVYFSLEMQKSLNLEVTSEHM